MLRMKTNAPKSRVTETAICATTSSERSRGRGVVLWLARMASDKFIREEASDGAIPLTNAAIGVIAAAPHAKRQSGVNSKRRYEPLSGNFCNALDVFFNDTATT